MEITMTELEDAINFWRGQRPSTGEERALSPEVNALAKVYAMMICQRLRTIDLAALDPVPAKLVAAWQAEKQA
jgi:hypothetical protein